MRRIFSILMLLVPFLPQAQTVVSIAIDGTINPVTASFIQRSLEKAEAEKAECLIIQLNTPGGLLKSTTVIVSDILESPIPVVVFVSPSGAHAGSAGVFITLAAHIAAMAPGTNLGAAHPVDLQGEQDPIMNDKSTNDAAAFIRTIAQKRNRNEIWPEDAVRKSVAITENEALKQQVIDIVATSEDDLLKQINGKNIVTAAGPRLLHTASAHIQYLEMGFGEKILDIIGDPNIAYILLLIGLFGSLFELYNPGSIFPGIIGVISLILAFYSMHSLPINYAGVALIVFAVILFLLEIKIASHGLLAIGGILSMILGSMILIRADPGMAFVRISKSVIVSSVAVSALFFLSIIGLGLRAQRHRPVTGLEGLIGESGESLEPLAPIGSVRVHGERWTAEAVGDHIESGVKIRVIKMQNLKLFVEQLKSLS
jgi:membrane-bound serine protease (ClpP class)